MFLLFLKLILYKLNPFCETNIRALSLHTKIIIFYHSLNSIYLFWVCKGKVKISIFKIHLNLSVTTVSNSALKFHISGVFFRFLVSFLDFGCPFQILAVSAIFDRIFPVIVRIYNLYCCFFQILGVLFRFRLSFSDFVCHFQISGVLLIFWTK